MVIWIVIKGLVARCKNIFFCFSFLALPLVSVSRLRVYRIWQEYIILYSTQGPSMYFSCAAMWLLLWMLWMCAVLLGVWKWKYSTGCEKVFSLSNSTKTAADGVGQIAACCLDCLCWTDALSKRTTILSLLDRASGQSNPRSWETFLCGFEVCEHIWLNTTIRTLPCFGAILHKEKRSTYRAYIFYLVARISADCSAVLGQSTVWILSGTKLINKQTNRHILYFRKT